MVQLATRVSRQRVTPTRSGRESGASAVEFAMVLPVFVLIVGAIIDFGFIFAQQIAFNTSVRDAARAGVLSTMSGSTLTCAQVAQRARADGASGAVGAGAGDDITVTVTGAGGSCTLPAGSSTPTGDGGSRPCAGSATSPTTDLAVTVSYASSPPFPVPFLGTVTLDSRGNFQCEYT